MSPSFPAVQVVSPLVAPPDARVQVPGSKSITNRALVCAALAEGSSTLDGVLVADDTEAMVDCLQHLGVDVRLDRAARRIAVEGSGGALPEGPIDLDARQSGTTARFLLPLLLLGPGPYRLDGDPSLRRRPMAELIDAVRALGLDVRDDVDAGHLPLVAQPAAAAGSGARPRAVEVRGDITSQFLTALMLAGPDLPLGIEVDVRGRAVSWPYVAMTAAVMETFGSRVALRGPNDDGVVIDVEPGGYRGRAYEVEPDASAASYFFAAAAISGGRVQVDGLGERSLQGDIRFVDVLARMGAEVALGADRTVVQGTGTLHGIDVDLVDMPDMATTLAAVAVFADAPTRVRGVEVIHGHETDRIRDIVTELRRAGIGAEAFDDGFAVQPAPPKPTRFQTYDDHRMAMSLAVIGLRAPGIEIAEPSCVAKTFPEFFDVLDELRRPDRLSAR